MTSHFVFLTTLTWPFSNHIVNQVLPEAREDARAWFSSKQENKRRTITFVNNLYQNYQVSLNYFFLILFLKHNKLYQQTIPFMDCFLSTKLYNRSNNIQRLFPSSCLGHINHFYRIDDRDELSRSSNGIIDIEGYIITTVVK